MWFLRVWIIFIALLVALFLGTSLLVLKPSYRQQLNTSSYSLDLAQHNTEMLLKLRARILIDAVRDMSRTSSIVENLNAANTKTREVTKLKEAMTTAMKSAVSHLKPNARPALMIAVDYQGKQIARIGFGEKNFRPGRDGMVGYPLVRAALRGYLADDTWSVDGRLFMMAASPVLSRSKNRYVGALLIGQEVNKTFALNLKKQLLGDGASKRLQLSFFLRGKELSSTIDDAELGRLPQHYMRQRKMVEENGRSAAFLLGKGKKIKLIVVAALNGTAKAHNAFYAIIATPPEQKGMFSALSDLKGSDIGAGVWLLIGGILFLFSVIGFVLVHFEYSLPLNRLADEVQRVTRFDATRLEEHTHSGSLYRIAKLVNEIIDRGPSKSSKGKDKENEKDVDSILGSSSGSNSSSAASSSFSSDPRIAHDGAMPPLAAAPSLGVIASAGVEMDNNPNVDTLPSPAEGAMPLSTLDGMEDETAVSMLSLDGGGPVKPFSFNDEVEAAPQSGAFNLPPMALPSDGNSSGMPPMAIPGTDSSAPPPSLEVKVISQGDSQGQANEQEEYFKKVFDEFVAIKRSCGESTENITYEKFSRKLVKNRQSLMERYQCQDVSFRVYIKDGKAALKATPVT